MDIPSVTGTAQTAQAAQTQKPAAKAEAGSALTSDFETFLTMLTAQMQNQDPLNPIQSSDYAVQLATFSGVEQQVKTNDLLAGLGTRMAVMGMSQLAGWIGMEAKSAGATPFTGAPIALEPSPAPGAETMALVVRDGEGKIVDRMTMAASDEPFSWTGATSGGAALPEGAYSFQIESIAGGEVVATDPVHTYSRVLEARNVDGELMLTLQGGGEIKASDVTAVRAPDAT